MTRIVTRLPLIGRYFARRAEQRILVATALRAADRAAYARGCRDTEARLRTLVSS